MTSTPPKCLISHNLAALGLEVLSQEFTLYYIMARAMARGRGDRGGSARSAPYNMPPSRKNSGISGISGSSVVVLIWPSHVTFALLSFMLQFVVRDRRFTT